MGEKSKFCPGCGNSIEGVEFCQQCGMEVNKKATPNQSIASPSGEQATTSGAANYNPKT